MHENMDKTAFKKQSFEEADNNRKFWLSKTPGERLISAYRLSLRAYGFDPDDPPEMQKHIFSKRKHSS